MKEKKKVSQFLQPSLDLSLCFSCRFHKQTLPFLNTSKTSVTATSTLLSEAITRIYCVSHYTTSKHLILGYRTRVRLYIKMAPEPEQTSPPSAPTSPERSPEEMAKAAIEIQVRIFFFSLSIISQFMRFEYKETERKNSKKGREMGINSNYACNEWHRIPCQRVVER